MKNVRWRAIIKSAEKVCPERLEEYFYREHMQMADPRAGLPLKKEMAILTTLHSYANSINRTLKTDMYRHPKEWIGELSNFAD